MSISGKSSELLEQVRQKLPDRSVIRAFNDGNYAQALISTANVGHQAANAATGVAANAGKLAELAKNSPEILEPALEKLEKIKITPEAAERARGVLGKVGVGLVVAQGAYSVYKEDGILHKTQRAVVSALTAATGWAASAAGGVMAKGALTVGERISLWAAPVVLAGEVAYGGNTIIKAERAYESGDNAFKPDMIHHGNVIRAQAMVEGKLKTLGVTKDAEGHWDMTRPDNVVKFRQAITEQQTETRQVMDENTTIMPRWIQFTDRQSDMRAALESARSDMKILDSALAELPDYQQQQAEHHRQLSDRAPEVTALHTPDARPLRQLRDHTITG